MLTILDHVFSPIKNNDLDGTLARFARAGFVVAPEKVRHRRGRLTGFVRLTGSYLEFLSVVDEAEFNREAAREDRLFRQTPQPYGVGAITTDPEGLYRELRGSYPDMPPPHAQAEAGSADPRPRWTMCMLPRKAFPGANLFAIQYHEAAADSFSLRHGPNTIFALGGLVFCSASAVERKARWLASLARLATRPEDAGTALKLGGQRIEWLPPAEYRRRFGRDYNRLYEDFGALAGIKLLCTDLAVARAQLEREGFTVSLVESDRVFFQPDANTGFAFELNQSDPAPFLNCYLPHAALAC